MKVVMRISTSGRWQQIQLCYIRQSIRIVTDKRGQISQEKLDLMAARAKPKPGRESLSTAKSKSIPKSHSITRGERGGEQRKEEEERQLDLSEQKGRALWSILKVVASLIYLPTASSTATKTRSSPGDRAARIPPCLYPMAAQGAKRPPAGARRDACKAGGCSARICVWWKERGREYRCVLFSCGWIRAEKTNLYWQNMNLSLSLSLFLALSLSTCAAINFTGLDLWGHNFNHWTSYGNATDSSTSIYLLPKLNI